MRKDRGIIEMYRRIRLKFQCLKQQGLKFQCLERLNNNSGVYKERARIPMFKSRGPELQCLEG